MTKNTAITRLKRISRAVALACLLATAAGQSSFAAESSKPAVDPATLDKIRAAAMSSDWAYDRLEDLTDRIGPRLSGSPGAAAAVTQVAEAMKKIGAQVSLQPVKVPHWVRGAEAAELVEYAGRPAGITQKVVLTTLGGSSATPTTGITAQVLVINSFDELQARAAEVKGRIVLFNVPFDQDLADGGHAGEAYGLAAKYRSAGPNAAAKLGAVAALMRSVTGIDYRMPHTGNTGFEKGVKLPAAAVSTEDAMLMARLSAKGPLSMHLTLTPQTLPDADSHNVIADLPGSDPNAEIVIISGHLDSWDLAHGAIDDGAGVTAAMGALEIIKRLGLQPRRTIRVIAWMNEENGGRGAQAYFDANKDKLASHFAAIESDSGAGKPEGMFAAIRPESVKLFAPLQKALLPLGAPVMRRADALHTGDLTPLELGGVPSFEPLLDRHTYFHYHHSAADTLDKVEPDNLRRQVALMAMMSWYLSNMPEAIGRAPEFKP
ncbi:M20/M25/M40 family metallo-hydrolase [Undibacterium terreum]|uniref:Carboxypeptidase Q n=1 Tax=Undibacterium terreum TaxID=1224302 RepID=A0A916UC16_9BURK|nr:M20/M25/M40 family metallo-hydrolase [Undibacterium terreum]GGC68089.1 peptidase M28 [Undibacterium terreum]